MKADRFIPGLAVDNRSKMILLVLDGLGGLPWPENGLTELEAASTPNLDRLAARSACGLIHPVSPGITPGSGPGHLALFGYDPLEYQVGRGILSALGLGLEVGPGEVAARVNFCTVDGGVVTDRRAGRIPTEVNAELCQLINERVKIPGLSFTMAPEKEHRAALILRGEGLSDALTDSDPEKTGLPPLPVKPRKEGDERAERSAELVNAFLGAVGEALAGRKEANMILVRGFSGHPRIPPMSERYGLKAGAIATYPMYKGLARLVGMEILDAGESFQDEVDALEREWENHHFFFLHYKKTDSAGEDGDYQRKVACIEEVDSLLPRILSLEPEVLAVTGDHSTPALLRSHSWHPCPLLLASSWEIPDGVERFSERHCAQGGLGIFPAVHLMPMMLANAGRLGKYGA